MEVWTRFEPLISFFGGADAHIAYQYFHIWQVFEIFILYISSRVTGPFELNEMAQYTLQTASHSLALSELAFG